MEKSLIPAQMDTTATTLFQPDKMAIILAEVERQAREHVPCIQTVASRKEIASNAAKVASSKTFLSKICKDAIKIDADILKDKRNQVKSMEDKLDALKAEMRKPLTAWEDLEKEQEAGIQRRIDKFRARNYSSVTSVDKLLHIMTTLNDIEINELYGKYKEVAQFEKDKALNELTVALDARRKYEADQAEFARLRRVVADLPDPPPEPKVSIKVAEEWPEPEDYPAPPAHDKTHLEEIETELMSKLAEYCGMTYTQSVNLLESINTGKIERMSIDYSEELLPF